MVILKDTIVYKFSFTPASIEFIRVDDGMYARTLQRLPHEEFLKMGRIDPNRVGMPIFYSSVEDTVYFYPVPDKSYKTEVLVTQYVTL
jgi:hypothetical protein